MHKELGRKVPIIIRREEDQGWRSRILKILNKKFRSTNPNVPSNFDTVWWVHWSGSHFASPKSDIWVHFQEFTKQNFLKHIMYYFAVSGMKDFETAFFILDVLIRLCKDFETLEASWNAWMQNKGKSFMFAHWVQLSCISPATTLG